MTITITHHTSTDALNLLIDKGGYEPEQLSPLRRWLDRGDDVIVFEPTTTSARWPAGRCTS